MNSGVRKVVACVACGEPREIAARGLCFKCYRREVRAAERALATDRHSPGIRREQKKVIKAYAQVMSGLADLAVSHNDVHAILDILRPYLRLAEDLIPGAGSVNSEHQECEFTVHGGVDNADINGS